MIHLGRRAREGTFDQRNVDKEATRQLAIGLKAAVQGIMSF